MPSADIVTPPSEAPLLYQTDPAVLSLARGTRAAAIRGDCVGARVLGSRIARLDPEFHRTVIRTDPVITQCRQTARTSPIVAREQPGGVMQRRIGTPPIDGGRIFGELIVGGLFTIGGAFGGAFLGIAASGGCDNGDDCVTIAGSMVASLLSIGLAAKAGDEDTSVLIILAAPTIGAIIGFNMSRQYKDVRVSLQPTPMKMGEGGVGLSLATGTF
jgi:hypothetical protein